MEYTIFEPETQFKVSKEEYRILFNQLIKDISFHNQESDRRCHQQITRFRMEEADYLAEFKDVFEVREYRDSCVNTMAKPHPEANPSQEEIEHAQRRQSFAPLGFIHSRMSKCL
jgi:hypothetical protein